jgi:iron complex outermembrane receptor protein
VVFSSTVDFTGNRLPNTPRFKFSGTAEYRFDLGRWGTPSVRYDMSWTDDVFFDPSQGTGVETPPFFSELELPEYAIGQRAYMLHDLRVGYLFPNSSIEISGWVRNITNEIYKSYVADTTVFFGSLQNLIGEPRTYGVSASVTF